MPTACTLEKLIAASSEIRRRLQCVGMRPLPFAFALIYKSSPITDPVNPYLSDYLQSAYYHARKHNS